MRIGEVARLAGVSARSIRHYHRLGVLVEPPRTPGGYREYDVGDLARIARIAFLNSSGVPLREIGGLLGAADGDDPATDLAAIRSGIDQQIDALARQRDRLEVIARRAASGQPPGLLPETVSRALDTCRAEAAGDADLVALIDREHDLLDLVALQGDFPAVLASSYRAIGTDSERRRRYLDMLVGFHALEGRSPAEAEPEISRLVDAMLADPDLRALVTGAPDEQASAGTAESVPAEQAADVPGPTLDQLVSDPAQREVLHRTLTALGVLP